MPWLPELFSAPVPERALRQDADARAAGPVPCFAGVISGETNALVGSFAGIRHAESTEPAHAFDPSDEHVAAERVCLHHPGRRDPDFTSNRGRDR